MVATHKLHVSTERLEKARSWLASHADTLTKLGADVVLLAAVSVLICDEEGFVSEADVTSALCDSRVISAANRLISEAIG